MLGGRPQKLIIPNAVKNLKNDGLIVSLVKPHYEKGSAIIDDEDIKKILSKVKEEIKDYVDVVAEVESPLVGLRGGNKEWLWLLKKN